MSARTAFLTKRPVLSVSLLATLALLCRLICLGRKSLTGDEAVTYLLGARDWHYFWSEVSSHELNMSPYFAMMRWWVHVGTSEFALRLLGVLFATATVPVLYWLARRFFSREVSLVACLLFSVNTGHLFYSQEARAYTLAVLTVTTAALFLAKAVGIDEEGGGERAQSAPNWIGFVLVAGFATYVHFYCLFVITAFGLALLLYPGIWSRWKALFAVGFAILLFAAPAIWYSRTHNVGQIDWIPPLSLSGISKVPTLLAGSPAALVFYLIFWIVGIRFRCRETSPGSRERWKYWFLLSWLVVPVAIAILLSLKKSVLVERYLLILIAPAVMLAADGLWRLRRARSVLLVLVVLISIGGDVRLYRRRSLQDARSASEMVFKNADCGDTVLFVWAAGNLPFQYYRDRTHLLDHCGGGEALKFRTVQQGIDPESKEIWIVVLGPKQLSADVQAEWGQAKQMIPAGYSLSKEGSFEAFRVMEYSKAIKAHPSSD